MKKLILICGLCLATSAFATDYHIDLKITAPTCGTFTITESSNRAGVAKNCSVVNTHSGSVRLFRGSETMDFMTNNDGIISCKFNRSAVNSDGTIKKCWTTTPPVSESAIITVKTNASTESVSKQSASMAK